MVTGGRALATGEANAEPGADGGSDRGTIAAIGAGDDAGTASGAGAGAAAICASWLEGGGGRKILTFGGDRIGAPVGAAGATAVRRTV
jgi:hypothetical protein